MWSQSVVSIGVCADIGVPIAKASNTCCIVFIVLNLKLCCLVIAKINSVKSICRQGDYVRRESVGQQPIRLKDIRTTQLRRQQVAVRATSELQPCMAVS